MPTTDQPASPAGASLWRVSSMRRLLLTLVTLVLALDGVRGGEIIFEGIQPTNRRTIERRGSRGNLPADSIKAMLVSEGYLDAVVRSEAGRVIVQARGQSMLNRILWLDDSTLQSNIGLPFTRQNIEDIIERRLTQDRNAGFFYSSAAVRSIARVGNAISLEIFLNPGPKLALNATRYNGLSRTGPDLIDRYLTMETGDLIIEKELRRAERRAADIPFVTFKPPINVRPLPGYTQADLEYNFTEKKQVLISGGAGYSPGNSSSVVWSLDLAFQNLFGAGRRARLMSERREESRQILDISYRQPVFLFGVGDLGFGASTRDYRDQFYEFSLGVDYRTRLSNSFWAGLKLGWRSVEPSGAQPSYNAFTSDVTIENSSIDDAINPSSGTSLVWTIAFAYRRYANDSLASHPERAAFNETRTAVKAQWFQRLKANLIGHIRLEFLGLQTAESLPPMSELFLIGGLPAIRGFRNEQFAALRTAYGTLEPRFRYHSGYLFLFYDGAYINNRAANPAGDVVTSEFYRYGYGLGVAIVERGRSVKVSLGWNPDLPFDQPRLSLEFSSEI